MTTPIHLFLSPHPDDIAMSCGGQIAQLTRQGERVTILTMMAGDPPKHLRPTMFTRELEVRWEVAATPFEVRREEDQAAARKLGARIQFLEIADAPYRCDAQGNAYYPDWQSIISAYHPADDAIIEQLITVISRVNWRTLHAPLGAGNHVDHRIAREAAKRLGGEVYFYEDYPYTVQDQMAVAKAVESLGIPITPVRRHIDNAAIDAKIAAIACYRTQLSTFWKNVEEMSSAIHTHTAQYGEVEWSLSAKD